VIPVFDGQIAATQKLGDFGRIGAVTFKRKTIWVTGVVTVKNKQRQIEVDDPGQIGGIIKCCVPTVLN